MPEHVLMSDMEIVTDGGRRRRWSAAEKLRIVDETLDDRASISVVARRNGVAPNLFYRWRRLMLEGGSVAVSEDDDVTSNKVVRQMEDRIRELERQLGRKNAGGRDPARGAGQVTVKKTDLAHTVASEGRFPVKVVAETLGVARSNLIDRLNDRTKPRRRYQKAQDGEGRRPKAKRRPERGAVDHDAGGGPTDLWPPADYGNPEPAAALGRAGARQSQEGLSHHEGPQPASGAQIHGAPGACSPYLAWHLPPSPRSRKATGRTTDWPPPPSSCPE